MSEWKLLRIAIWREIYARRKGFLVTTGLALTLVVGGLSIAALTIETDDPTTIGVGVLAQGGDELEAAIQSRLGPETRVSVTRVATRQSGEDELRSGSISALVMDPGRVLWAQDTPQWITEVVASAMSEVNIIRAAADLGLQPEEVNRLLTPVVGETIDFEERDESLQVLSVITVILMFVAIISYGQWIAYGVVEEKANRVAELILGALSPAQLLTAKLVSLGGMGLTQLAIVGGVAVVTAANLTEIPLPVASGSALGWLIVWFLIGFAFYGSLYAASGSLASDTQEAGSFIGPLNLLPGLGYMIGVIAFSAGSVTLTRVISLIPLWTPMLMPGRIASGTVEWWELAISVALMIVATLAMIRFAAGVYLGGITQATRRVGWRQAFRGGRDLAAE